MGKSSFSTASKKLKVINAGGEFKDEDDEDVDMAIKSVHNASQMAKSDMKSTMSKKLKVAGTAEGLKDEDDGDVDAAVLSAYDN